MFKCLGCEDVVCSPGSCHCGKLVVDKKLRPLGDHFAAADTVKIVDESAYVGGCDQCCWSGLVVPKAGIGCPEHGPPGDVKKGRAKKEPPPKFGNHALAMCR